MPLPQKQFYTAEDYWNLPENVRAELIDGQIHLYSGVYPRAGRRRVLHFRANGTAAKILRSP